VSGSEPKWSLGAETTDSSWKGLYRFGGTTALITIAVVLTEIGITFLPGVQQASASTVTVVDWFTLLQNNWFLGLRNLGLLNIVGAALLVPTFLAVYSALRRDNEAYGALGTILFFVGVAVYLASNRAFPMLSLSGQYASATTDVQRSFLVAAGQAMLAEGESRPGVLLIEFAGLAISMVMLRGKTFSKAVACAGILGNALMMIVEISFMPPRGVWMVVAAAGGLSLMTWYLLVGRRLLQLGHR
jgi:hypothetical protein